MASAEGTQAVRTDEERSGRSREEGRKGGGGKREHELGSEHEERASARSPGVRTDVRGRKERGGGGGGGDGMRRATAALT